MGGSFVKGRPALGRQGKENTGLGAPLRFMATTWSAFGAFEQKADPLPVPVEAHTCRRLPFPVQHGVEKLPARGGVADRLRLALQPRSLPRPGALDREGRLQPRAAAVRCVVGARGGGPRSSAARRETFFSCTFSSLSLPWWWEGL